MKKLISFVFVLLVAGSLTSCDSFNIPLSTSSSIESSTSEVENSSSSTIESNISESSISSSEIKTPTGSFEILAMNDTHGQLTDKSDFATTAGYIADEKENNDALFISSGDQFQGTALSNLSTGEVFVDALNAAGLDSLTIGNHEFDWGIDKIQRFRDGDLTNGEANFPILCANVTLKTTGELIEGFDPYAVFNTNGYKVGVIGVIDDGCKSSILVENTEDYNFTDETVAVRKYTEILRNDEGCDFVVVSIHGGSSCNDGIVDGLGEYSIDAIFNAHTHQLESGMVSGTDVPHIQGQANGTYISKIEFNVSNDEVQSVNLDNINTAYLSNGPLAAVTEVISEGFNKYDSIINQKLTYFDGSNSNFKNLAIEYWNELIVKSISNRIDNLVFFSQNTGGIRSTPDSNSDFTFGKLYEIIPFDNTIYTCEITGATLKQLIKNIGPRYDNPFYCSLDESEINDNEYYTVGSNSYVFTSDSFFMDARNAQDTYIVIRDVLKEDLILHDSWNPATSEVMLVDYVA